MELIINILNSGIFWGIVCIVSGIAWYFLDFKPMFSEIGDEPKADKRLKNKRLKFIIGLIIVFTVIGLFFYYMPEPIATVLTVALLGICYFNLDKL
ncbi:MAG: hypothetical protein ACI4LK_06570 [Lentihominibacter sp.]